MPLLRACSTNLATALATGTPRLVRADLFTLVRSGGIVNRFTSSDIQPGLTVGGAFYGSGTPWLEGVKWDLTNTMQVPTLEMRLTAQPNVPAFNGGTLSWLTLIHNGLLDGATFDMQRLFMPQDVFPPDTATYGTIDLFQGDVGKIELNGAVATITVRARSSRLAVPTPLNVYQPGCIHTFCDAGCTLSLATFTVSTSISAASSLAVVTVGTLPTPTSQLQAGTIKMTSGNDAGLSRSIIQNSSGTTLVLADPFPFVPQIGDTCTVTTGCDKTLATCNTTYSNKVNFRGFPFIPPPPTAAAGQ